MRKNRSIIAITVIFSLLFTLLTGLSSSSEPVMAAKKVSTPKISVSAVSGGTGIKVTIKKTKNAEGYCIYLKGPQDEQFVEAATLEKSGKAKRKYTLKNLPGGEYSIKVKAYLKSGTKTVWSKESKVAVITIKGTGSSAGNGLPADVKEYVDKNYSYLLPLYDQGLINFSAEYETKDYITLGSYDMWCYNEKSKYGQDGKKEPMVWEVLEYSPDNKTALVISKYVIKTFEHDPSDTFKKKTTFTWEQSSHRTWLNNNFYKAVFSDKEKTLINEVTLDNSSMKNGGKDTKDKIFFLSPSEVQKYYPSEDEEGRSFERGCTDCNSRSEHWALRSPAPGNENNLSYVSYAGKIETYSSVSFYSLGIRPACRITLTDEIISKNNLSISKEHKKVLKNVYVTIGSYTENDKKSALEWQVLEYDENAGKALLIRI